MNQMKDYRNYLEPGVKESFDSAVKAIRETVGESVANIVDMDIKEAIVDYNVAAYMHGYFNAMASAFPDYRIIFYTAATNMIHFKYYHYNEN